MTVTARLAFVTGPEDGKEIRRTVPVVFGRLTDCDVPVPYDGLASRQHAKLSHDGSAFILEDLGSRNGTYFLTGEPLLAPARIEPGALFRVGGVWFRLLGASAAS